MHSYYLVEKKKYMYIGLIISELSFCLSGLLLLNTIENKNDIKCSYKLNKPIINIVAWIEVESISTLIASFLLFLFSLSFKCDKEIKNLYTKSNDLSVYNPYNNIENSLSNINIIKYILGSILCLYKIFNIIWITIGSIMFWHDCFPITPKYINNIILIELIYGYFILFFIIGYYILH